MTLWVRKLALVLALVSAVGPQLLAAIQSADPCADESGDCSDCSSCADCAMACGCCPVRVATLGGIIDLQIVRAPELEIVAQLNEPVVSAVGPDIFHPPKA